MIPSEVPALYYDAFLYFALLSAACARVSFWHGWRTLHLLTSDVLYRLNAFVAKDFISLETCMPISELFRSWILKWLIAARGFRRFSVMAIWYVLKLLLTVVKCFGKTYV